MTEKTLVEFQTSLGNIVLELDPEKAPKTVENFLDYVNSGFYDGTIFHRVIDGFVIQGGGFDSSMNQKTTKAPIANEANNGLHNEEMSISMARTPDPNSATSQFFISLVDNKSRLDYKGRGQEGYAVFGKVVSGDDIVRKIGKVSTAVKGMYSDVPRENVVVLKAKLKKPS